MMRVCMSPKYGEGIRLICTKFGALQRSVRYGVQCTPAVSLGDNNRLMYNVHLQTNAKKSSSSHLNHIKALDSDQKCARITLS
jgi:hypothetical protein